MITVTTGEGEQQTQVTREKTDEEFTEAENNKERLTFQATNILIKAPRHIFNHTQITPENGKIGFGRMWSYSCKDLGRLRCKGVTKEIFGVIPKGLALRVVLVDLHSKDESGKGFKREFVVAVKAGGDRLGVGTAGNRAGRVVCLGWAAKTAEQKVTPCGIRCGVVYFGELQLVIRAGLRIDTSPKKKHVQATKGTSLKSKAKVAKPNKKKQPAKKTKAKGLAILSKVALTEAEQIKLATKRSKKDFHVSYESGSGDGVDTQSRVPDEQQQKTFGADEETGTILGVPDVSSYEYESDKESWGDSKDEDDNDDDGNNDNDGESDTHDDDSDDERTESNICTPSDYELTDEEKLDDEETMDDEEDDEVIKELYGDVKANLGNNDTEMNNVEQGASEQQNVSQESGFEQEEKDAHVTLTLVLEAQKTDELVQSSSVSSDFTSKLLNLENPSPTDNEIASLMVTSAHHATVIPEITSGFTTTSPPLPLFFNPLLQQQTPSSTTTTSTNPIVTLPEIPNFASVFKFDQRVSALESKISEFRQTNQFTKVVSLISGIVDSYLASKMKEAVDVAVQLQTNKLREEAQAENQEFLNQTSYALATALSEFELKKILIDKMEANKSIDRSGFQKNLYNALFESYNNDNDIMSSYGDVVILKRERDDQDKDKDPFAGSDRRTKRRKSGKDAETSKDSRSKEKKSLSTSKYASHHKSSGKSAHAEEPSHTVEDSGMQQDQEFIMRDNDEQPANKDVTKADWFKKPKRPPTPDPDWNLEYLKGRDLSRQYSNSMTKTKAATYELKWIEDLVPELWSPVQLKYDQHAYFGTSNWGPKRLSFYEYASNLTSSKDVYSRRRIIKVTRLMIMKKYDYGHQEEIEVRRDDQKLYTFKECDFKRLHLQDIEDMLLLLVQQKLTNLTIDKRYDLNVALRMFTRRIVIQRGWKIFN
ncbi:hypothetical protein Tco_0812087 [Tanacetum coccineum]